VHNEPLPSQSKNRFPAWQAESLVRITKRTMTTSVCPQPYAVRGVSFQRHWGACSSTCRHARQRQDDNQPMQSDLQRVIALIIFYVIVYSPSAKRWRVSGVHAAARRWAQWLYCDGEYHRLSSAPHLQGSDIAAGCRDLRLPNLTSALTSAC
jgi:hypothetical protein